MKIRIEDNSIRLRLRRSEVRRLRDEGRITAYTPMPEGRFEYALELSESCQALHASKTAEGILIALPAADGRGWDTSPRVGFEHNLSLSDGGTLHLLVEKDFVCLDRSPESQEDQYPNPKAGTV